MDEPGIGYGSLFEISTDGGATWASPGQATSLTPPSFAVDAIDVTHMQSPSGTREFIPGLVDPGECSIEMNFMPGSAGEAIILSVLRMKVKARATFPDGESVTFDAIITGYSPAVPMDEKMTATLTVKVSGVVEHGAAAAPVNSIKPAISGVAQVGQVLTAYPGVWSGAPSYDYQWKNEGTNLAGATSQTYTLQASDAADTITVTVTATNSEGSASATSAGLADIAA
ncbi:hypothetical protein J2S76_004188 [Ancylobacter vacuolatus]|uniref:Lambda phage tail tube protein N-terminal domain-containing protein n=2 Tax=Ancylobacter vacuolatus TaxID=223389 RepID=A0ABU0DMV0_9HYPH|nr:phage tail tube protein [Ancylobacter vacuolatus]MDQ0349737.1 hypothetical protein [Ancylobacter vacuolatus]